MKEKKVYGADSNNNNNGCNDDGGSESSSEREREKEQVKYTATHHFHFKRAAFLWISSMQYQDPMHARTFIRSFVKSETENA